MIRGAIDNLNLLPDGRVRLYGWASETVEGKVAPIKEFVFDNEDGYKIPTERFNRKDIKGGDFGFHVTLPGIEALARLYYGASKIFAVGYNEEAEISFWERIKCRVASAIVVRELDNIPANELENVKGRVLRAGVSHADGPLGNKKVDTLLQVGGVSYDNSVVVGEESFLYLYSGSNAVHEQYISSLNDENLEGWIDVMYSRNSFLAGHGISFFQMIIPEKQSVIFENYPLKISTPTPMLKKINQQLKCASFYVDAYASLRELFINKGLYPYRKVDTHLSIHGVVAIIKNLMGDLGVACDFFPHSLKEVVISGDLGGKILKGNMYERSLIPDFDEWEFSKCTPTCVRSYDPPAGHGGIVREWICDCPKVDKHVLIFGNSIFERGGSPFGLSWWCSRIFRKTTFVWSASVDKKLVEEYIPDIVIAQTVERFLSTTPMS